MARKRILKGYFFWSEFIAAVLIVVFLLQGCSGDEPRPQNKPPGVQGFTFFDLGANSLYSHSIRQELSQKLGPDAVSQKNTMDLSINYKGFLEEHFPALSELNQRLNWPPRQRVEHETTKLVYRYARKQNTPFNYVELFFSDDSLKPLFFKITAGPEGGSMVDTILKKYGQPKEFAWGQMEGRTLFWEEGRDVFMVSSFINRWNSREYLICIYFVENLEEMLKSEETRRVAEKERMRKAGRSAF